MIPIEVPTEAQRIGERLRNFREARGMSQQDLADATEGVYQADISRYEIGKVELGWKVARRLAAVLRIDPKDFF